MDDMRFKRERGGGSLFSGLLIGAIIGAAIALLTAPKSGREIRETIGERTGEIREKAMDVAGTIPDKARSVYYDARDKAASKLRSANQELREENQIMEDVHNPEYPL